MVHKEFGIGAVLLENKNALGNVKYAFITRSFTKGISIEPQSIDFMIVGDINIKPLNNAIKVLEEDSKREIHYTVMTEEEFEYRKSKRDIFLLNILAGSKVMVIGDEDELLSTE